MARRMRYYVSPDKREGGWKVKSGGGESSYGTKQAAVTSATQTARQQGNAQVVIRTKDGTIQSERTYGTILAGPWADSRQHRGPRVSETPRARSRWMRWSSGAATWRQPRAPQSPGW